MALSAVWEIADVVNATGQPCVPGLHQCGDKYHGICHDNTCHCRQFYQPPDCKVPFTKLIPTGWTVVRSLIGIVQGCVVLLCLLDLYARYRLRHSGMQAVRNAPSLITNPRGIAFLFNMAGSAVRLVWLIDPYGFAGVFPPGFSHSFLMRIPQCCWIFAFCQVGLVWMYVTGSFSLSREVLERRMVCMRTAVYVFVCVIAVATITFAVLATADLGGLVAVFGGNVVMVVAVLVIYVTGCKASSGVRRLLSGHRETASQQQRERFQAVLRNTAVTIILATVATSLLFPAVALAIGLKLVPWKDPAWEVVFLLVVHICVEGTIACALFWNTHFPGFWRQLPCGCRREVGAMALLHNLSVASTDSDEYTRASVGTAVYNTPS